MRLSLAGVLAVAALLSAPMATADPTDLEPYCTGGQTPLFGLCKMQTTDPDLDTTGLDPEVATGLNPEMFPAI